ncbi:hypothetical protein [Micromonospora chersina]|uniref:hypothetical protein n=1 Tax=Micromonospora chersina TaxID=47854 RepID=UPI0033A5DC99
MIVRRAARQENPGRELGVAERAAAIDHLVRVDRRNHTDAARVLGISARTVIRHVHRDPARG